MSLTIRTRLLGLAVLGPIASLGVALVGLRGLESVSTRSEAVARAGQVLRNHMECDMMHDAIRGDAALLVFSKSQQEQAEFVTSIREHVTSFRERLAENKALADDPKIIAAIEVVEPEMRMYLQAASTLADQASVDTSRGLALHPEVEARFHKLETLMGSLSDTVEARVTEVVHQSQAESRTANAIMLYSVGGATLALGIIGLASARTVARRVSLLTNRMEAIAAGEGELSARQVHLSGNDEIARIAAAFNHFSAGLAGVVREASNVTDEVKRGSLTICQSLDAQAGGIKDQALSVEQIAAAIEQLSSSVSEIAQSSLTASESASNAGHLAGDGQEVVGKTISRLEGAEKLVTAGAERVAELGKRSEQINAIVTSIQEIADQTNLLALNAAIEAARAGEHGRGFAVVADEVRKLAERTTGATREVAEAIKAIQTDTTQANAGMSKGAVEMDEVAKLARSAQESLARIVEGARGTATMIKSIADSTSAQRSASDDISKRVMEIQQLSETTRGLSATSNQAAGQLATRAESLGRILEDFSGPRAKSAQARH